MLSSVEDRVALQGAKWPAPRAREEPPPTSTYKPAGRARRLSDAEIKAAFDRAMARSGQS
jgi:hypothetical protein